MTTLEKERLHRYLGDAGQWLAVTAEMLRHPETAHQAAALTLAKAANEIIAGIAQQIRLDDPLE